ncbi:MAG: hypothetical protein OXQ29_11140, partial [Rhodospirillaceae bacterium]|nr:hypothetical protein [Rhodospirillaceae bacterium]
KIPPVDPDAGKTTPTDHGWLSASHQAVPAASIRNNFGIGTNPPLHCGVNTGRSEHATPMARLTNRQ